ncbi:TolC family protein [Bdellovibrio sp. HCB-162]|uniref:TolC family protein n=1 Tax=Bdellovibrio sp. HCB-162 TaxID=3394234 RepID=UPI0039BC2854
MKKSDILKFSSLTLIFAALLSANSASALSLNEYLGQVQQQSSGYKASSEQAEASALKSREADLIFTPRLFANARIGHDGKEQFASAITYDRLRMQNYSLGVSQDFSFGLQTKLSYALDKIQVEGATLPAGMGDTFWTATPTLELTMPLWANGFGRSARANEDLTRQQNKAEQYGAQAQNQGYMVEAEAAYWRLSSAQEVVQVQTRALKNAQSILDYVSRKARMNLGENADVLQAKALVEATTYQLQLAQNQEKSARRAFNTYINKGAEESVPSLESINYGSLEKVAVPTAKPGDRYDVKAAEAQARLAKSSATLVAERNKPSVDLYGSYALNGRDEEMNEAMKNAGYTQHDTAFVGVRMSMPLNFSATSDAKAGALKAQRAAELSYQYKQFTQEQDWTNLVQQLGEAKENLRLATNIVNAQKAKLENERTRLRQGRTTTYQVLLFEQDFSQSEVNRVQAASQILGLQAQIKLYQASSSEGGI